MIGRLGRFCQCHRTPIGFHQSITLDYTWSMGIEPGVGPVGYLLRFVSAQDHRETPTPSATPRLDINQEGYRSWTESIRTLSTTFQQRLEYHEDSHADHRF
jgi:hypothetical protein